MAVFKNVDRKWAHTLLRVCCCRVLCHTWPGL